MRALWSAWVEFHLVHPRLCSPVCSAHTHTAHHNGSVVYVQRTIRGILVRPAMYRVRRGVCAHTGTLHAASEPLLALQAALAR